MTCDSMADASTETASGVFHALRMLQRLARRTVELELRVARLERRFEEHLAEHRSCRDA